MEINFPVKGLFRGVSFTKQAPLTTPYCQNVRPFDVEEGRMRGGQRPGLVKAFDSQLASGSPVLRMTAINTVYIGAS